MWYQYSGRTEELDRREYALTHGNTSHVINDYDLDEEEDEDSDEDDNDISFLQCNFGELECTDNSKCYRESERCDGYYACKDKSDEDGCPKIRGEIFMKKRKNSF